RLDVIQLAAVLAGGGAVILMIAAGEGTREMTLIGAFFLALSTVSTAMHSILTRMHRARFTPAVITGWVVISGALFFTILLLIDHWRSGDILSFYEPLKDIRFLLSAAYLGIGCILLSSLTITYTFRILPAAKAGVFSNISTVISILAGGIILHEPLTFLHVLCVSVVIAAAFIVNRRKERLA
ncbi:MAG: DMT family transporter, partial [Lachnospiraceae bacterium]|nr:DMT family transporter [Lachnospiraceae bacterium]